MNGAEDRPAAARSEGTDRKLADRLQRAALPLAVFVGLMALWEAVVDVLKIPTYLVPAPSAVFLAFIRGFAEAHYLFHALITGAQAVMGFLVGTALCLAIGVLVVVFPTMERIVYPYIVALQTVPKVAIAPLMIVWFGFGIESKIVIVALVSLFPVLVNVIAGLKSIDQDRLDLMSALSASRWQILRYLRFPNALPFIFAGLNTAIVFSVIGAIVGEFVGSNRGLGFLILQANFALDIAAAFALFVVLSIMGVTLHFTLQYIQTRVVFWAESEEFFRH
ncbi:MAG: ABC transporter permease [Proteobacteria bacterium]|nr:ABC transporter permease [Pseudomonadota bacterium]